MHQLILLRHGESVWNKENRFTGWTDVDLSERGREESRSLNLPLPRPTVLTYPTVRALRLVADQKRSRVRVRNVATESTWDEACRVIAEG